MKYRLLIRILITSLVYGILFISCTKDSGNKLPDCVITAPANGHILNAEESVTIRVEASEWML